MVPLLNRRWTLKTRSHVSASKHALEPRFILSTNIPHSQLLSPRDVTAADFCLSLLRALFLPLIEY